MLARRAPAVTTRAVAGPRSRAGRAAAGPACDTALMSEQRETFDDVADLYARTRPPVPGDALIELFERVELGEGSRVLEIGSGTGQLTRHLLERGADVTCVEPGAQLAAICEQELGCERLHVEVATFEDWEQEERRFHAVLACQAAHWIDPYLFLDRAGDALEPDGALGLLWHVDLSEGTEFWNATQPLYDSYLPDAAEKPPATIPLYMAAYLEVLRDDARFGPPDRKDIPWRRTFDTETYLALLRTHSPVRMLSDVHRAEFLEGHREILERFGGTVERIYETAVITTRLEEY